MRTGPNQHPRAVGPNVLISSAGRRVGLVRAFQEAVTPLGGRVVATDSAPELSAACQVADLWERVPKIAGPRFLDSTLEVALRHGAGLVIPTLDTELAAYASVRDQWAESGVSISVSDPTLVEVCRDKRRMAALFESVGIAPIREVESTFPRLVKPISGSLSADIHVVNGPDELPARIADRTAFVHQELIDRTRYTEYSVDMLYSRDGRLICAVPRRRIEVRGGEISKGCTDKGLLLHHLRDRLGSLAGARGCLTLQVFQDPESQQRPVVGIELNARFGGGYPMSHAAGGRFADWLVAENLANQLLAYRDDWEHGVTFLRYDEHVVVRS